MHISSPCTENWQLKESNNSNDGVYGVFKQASVTHLHALIKAPLS